jgi:hypothetical protein
MNQNRPKLVGFDAPLNLAVGAQGVLTMTAPHNFVAKRLMLVVIDPTQSEVNAVVDRLLWNNQELKAGGPILTSAFPAGWATTGTNGWPIEFELPVKVADNFSIVITNGIGAAAVTAIAWWITDYGKGGCCG